MNISKRDQSLLLTLAGLLVFLAAYLGIYNNLNSKTETVKSEISSLQPRLTELREHYNNLASYEAGIDESIEHVETALEKYPDDVRPEELLMYAIALENDVGLEIRSVSFAPAEPVSRFQIVREGENGNEFVPMAAMRTGFSADCGLSYPELKRLINYIYATKHCTTLDSVSINYSAENGELAGTVQLSKYFVSSMDYSYEPTKVPDVPQGTSNPFGTFTVAPAPSPTPSPAP